MKKMIMFSPLVFLIFTLFPLTSITSANPVSETISASVSGGGSISPSGNVPVPYGASQTFKYTPYSDFAIGSVVVDGQKVNQPVNIGTH